MAFSVLNIGTYAPAKDYVIYSLPLPSSSLRSYSSFNGNDTNPSVGTTSPIGNVFNDGRFNVPYAVGTGIYSIGVALARTMDVYGVSLFDYDDGTVGSGIYWSGSNAGLYALTSANGTVWSAKARVYPINRQPWSGSIYRTDIYFGNGIDTYTSCRYVKLNAFSGSLMSARGQYLKPTEIVVWTMPTKVSVGASGSLLFPNKLTINPIRLGGIVIPQSTVGSPSTLNNTAQSSVS